jgi:hypothetical protein
MLKALGNALIIIGILSDLEDQEEYFSGQITYSKWDGDKKDYVIVTEPVIFKDNKFRKNVQRMRSYDFNGKRLILQCVRQKDGTLQAYDFNFSNNIIRTKYKDKSGKAKESRIYFGKVYIFDDPLKKTTTGKTYFRCTIGLRTYNGEEKSMDFVSLKFWDNDTERLAAKASKALKDKQLYAIGISEISEFTKKDGEIGFSATGYSIYDLNDGLEEAAPDEDDSGEAVDTSDIEDAFIGKDTTTTVVMTVAAPQMEKATAGKAGSLDDDDDTYPF